MKKYFKKAIDFIKEATWLQPILFVVAILVLIFGIQGCGKMVNKVKNADWGCACKKESGDPYTKILAEDVMEKRIAFEVSVSKLEMLDGIDTQEAAMDDWE